jgi:hypothetical protein
MKTELEQYLETEINYLENIAPLMSSDELTEEEIGYLEALRNCLDFIQGAEVYLNWKANQEGKK